MTDYLAKAISEVSLSRSLLYALECSSISFAKPVFDLGVGLTRESPPKIQELWWCDNIWAIENLYSVLGG